MTVFSFYSPDSERWKSSLTFDSLDDFNISNISSQDYNKFEKSPVNMKADHPSVARSYVQETNQSVQTTTTNLNPNETSLENASNKDFDLFNKYNSQKCHTRTANAFTSNNSVDTSVRQMHVLMFYWKYHACDTYRHSLFQSLIKML